MLIAVEGCCHGELENIYDALQYTEKINNFKVDLLLICGDFQAVRNHGDLDSMAVPQKYKQLYNFNRYYSGDVLAPVLTIFIGGNHEASNYLQELPYGGWVAKNIYYMGYANVLQVGGLRIGGLSGIYKSKDYCRGHFEKPPYTEDSKRSVYHIRSLEVFRLKQLSRPLDVFLSHDWPTGITGHGNLQKLLSRKPFLKDDILQGKLGSPPTAELLTKLQPAYWFSAHLHVKFAAMVPHSGEKYTRFLSLDKCLPNRHFMQIIVVGRPQADPIKISLDPEWLCILKSTNHLLSLQKSFTYMPSECGKERSDFTASDEDMDDVTEVFGGSLVVPDNFEKTAPTLAEWHRNLPSESILVNPQTSLLCTMLDITDPNAVLTGVSSYDSIVGQHEDYVDAGDHSNGDNSASDITSTASFLDSSRDISVDDTSVSGSSGRRSLQFDSSASFLRSPVCDDHAAGQVSSEVQDSMMQLGSISRLSFTQASNHDADHYKVKSEDCHDEFTAIMKAQCQQRVAAAAVDCCDVDRQKHSISGFGSQAICDQDISDQTLSPGNHVEGDCDGKKAEDVLECETDSLEEQHRCLKPSKRESPNRPDECCGKKLSRRNLSFYSSSETDNSFS